MERIDRSWWETDVYLVDIEDVMARVVQVAKKQDEIVKWINKHDKDNRQAIQEWLKIYEKTLEEKNATKA